MDYSSLLGEINHYIMDYLNQHTDERLTYHNAEHAQYVAKSALKISKGYKLDKEEVFILTVAAWFHDIGYIKGPENHELRGSEMAKEYLSALIIPVSVIERIVTLILATKMGHRPVDRLEEVIRDADLFHLGTVSFEEKNRKLHKEQEFLKQQKISEKDWFAESLEFLKSHKYYTIFCQLSPSNKKQHNIQLLQSKLMRLKAIKIANNQTKSSGDKGKKGLPGPGIDTFFQIASSNSQLLSNMADNKANILITVNSIIISAIISFFLRKLSDNNYLFIPIFLILAVSLVSMIFSILATRPKLSRGTFRQKELDLGQVNLLFFGNFYKMRLEKYTEGILLMVNDEDYFHSSLIKDVYYQGVVLGKKYSLLRIAYNIFMLGLVLAVLSFVVVFILHGHATEIKAGNVPDL